MSAAKRKKNKKAGIRGNKKNAYPSRPLDWKGTEKEKPFWTFQNVATVGSVLFVAFMVYLFFFVDDPQVAKQKEALAKMKAKEAAERAKPPKPFDFKLTTLTDLAQFNEVLQDEDNDVVVAVFDSTEKLPAPKLWKRWERLRKSMSKRGLFEKYDAENLPKIVRFDCNGEGKTFCSKVLGAEGTKKPQAVIFRQKQRPKPFPPDVRSDKKILQYLYDLMQPAVKYFSEENKKEFYEFVDPEDQIPRVMLFADELDREGPYAKAADTLRDYAKFGMTEDEALLKEGRATGDDDEGGDEEEADGDLIKMYRKFDDKEISYTGDAKDAGALTTWVKNNALPTLGEFTPQGKLRQRIQLRELPIVWIHIDRLEDGHDKILEETKPIAEKYKGTYTFTYVDSMTNAQFAKDLGATQAPQVMILSQEQEIRVDIETDSVATSIERAIDDYKKKVGGQGGPGAADDDDSDDDDEDYDEDDDDAAAGLDDKIDEPVKKKPTQAQPKEEEEEDDDYDADDDEEAQKKDL